MPGKAAKSSKRAPAVSTPRRGAAGRGAATRKPAARSTHGASSPADVVCFTATLQKPRTPQTPDHPGDSAWTFLLVPRAASAKLPSRGMVSVVGTIQGSPLRTTLHPDGKGGHWL
ncbi:MAG: DUF1905 domain-containing protein, partial [Phycisphaerales bacterium]